MREAAAFALTVIAVVAKDADEANGRDSCARGEMMVLAQVAPAVRRKGLHRAASLELAHRMHMAVRLEMCRFELGLRSLFGDRSRNGVSVAGAI